MDVVDAGHPLAACMNCAYSIVHWQSHVHNIVLSLPGLQCCCGCSTAFFQAFFVNKYSQHGRGQGTNQGQELHWP
jgi:hypothetical protein